MAVSEEYKAFIAELLEPVGPVRIRNMFGGAGVFKQEVMFGLIAGETLYLKVDDLSRPDFEAEGSDPFVYHPPSGKEIAMSYWLLPEALYDDPEECAVWARKAIDAALREQAKKPKKKPRRKLRAKSGGKAKRPAASNEK